MEPRNNLSNYAIYEVMLKADYDTIKNICLINKEALTIHNSEYFWEKKYLSENEKPSYKVNDWKKEYKLKHCSSSHNILFSLICNSRNRLDIACSLYTKNEDTAYEMITYMYNNNKINLQDEITQEIDRTYCLSISTKFADVEDEINNLIDLYDDRTNDMKSFYTNNPNYFTHIYFPNCTRFFLKLKENLHICLFRYYTDINMLYFSSASQEFKTLTLNFFKFAYNQNFKTDLCPYIPNIITKPYVSVDMIKKAFGLGSTFKLVKNDVYNY